MPDGNPVSGYRLERAMSAAMQLKALVADEDDAALLLGLIEGETDVLEILDRLVEQSVADAKLAELAHARAKRIDARSERCRGVVLQMLEALEISPLERPLYTASISHPRKPLVTNEAELPEAYIRHAPDMRAIGKALRNGEEVAGAVLSNPAPSLSIRTR